MRLYTISRARHIAVAAVVGLAAVQMAWATPLAVLVDTNGTILQGDKLFSDFQVTITGTAPYTVDPTMIDVHGITAGSDFGIQFSSLNTNPIIQAGASGYADMLISFVVTVMDPAMQIHDVGLTFTAAAPDDGFAQVVETAFDDGVVLGQIQVDSQAGNAAHLEFSPQTFTSLRILKDIFVMGGATDPALIWTIEQTFSQIPEPATLTLLGLGVLALCRRRGRRLVGRVLPVLALVTMISVMTPAVQATPLSTLIEQSGTITQGDKLFSNFEFAVSDVSGRVIANSAGLDVTGITIDEEYGLRFGGSLGAFSNVIPNSHATVTIAFDVAVLDPAFLIDDISLAFNGAVTRTGLTSVVEEVFSPLPQTVGSTIVAAPSSLSNHAYLNGYFSQIHVVKTILLDGGADGTATISFIDQTFSQVPEPVTVGLLALGLPLLRRRFH